MVKKILFLFVMLLATNSFGEICYTDIGGSNSFAENSVQLERLSCQQKNKLTRVLSNAMFAFEVTGTACTLLPHPAMKVIGVAIDIHGLMLGGLEAYVGTLDCTDDFATRKKAFQELCWDLKANGMSQLNCSNVQIRN
jgi:hypothetical protein